MSYPYALTIPEWGKIHFKVSVSTAYRIANGDNPPPMIILNRRRRVAVGSAAYQEWLCSNHSEPAD